MIGTQSHGLGSRATDECHSFGGHEKVTGFADTDRTGWHWTDDTDRVPAQDVDLRTRPHRADGLRKDVD